MLPVIIIIIIIIIISSSDLEFLSVQRKKSYDMPQKFRITKMEQKLFKPHILGLPVFPMEIPKEEAEQAPRPKTLAEVSQGFN